MLKKKTVLRFILGLKIRQLRNRHHFSLKELADKSDLSISYLNEIEKGKKYPKIEKLAALADALKTDLGDLVSFKTGRNLHPLLRFLESDLVSKVPLELFGLSESDVVDLMGYDPEKFASFVLTVLQISRSFDMKLPDVYTAALRSFIETNDNYFPEIEKLSKKARIELDLNDNKIELNSIKNILINKFHYKIDEETIINDPDLENVKSISKRTKNPILYLNSKLTDFQKTYIICMEIGFHYLGLQVAEDKESLAELLNDFRTRYFAGSLLLEEKLFSKELKNFFNDTKFNSKLFLSVLDKYKVSNEVMFHRLTQVLTAHFKVHELFFLELSVLLNLDLKYNIDKELHLSQLHSPHGVHSNEKYCRRWVAIKSLNYLKDNPDESVHLLGQISITEDGQEYFSMSMAYKSSIYSNTLQSLTIGFLINHELKNVVKFLDDKQLKRIYIGQTCERCPKNDCEDRAVKPVILNNEKKLKERDTKILKLLN